MRVLLASPAFAPQLGGAETWTRAIFTRLAGRGADVHVLARAVDGQPTDHELDGVRVERVPGGRMAYLRAVRRAVTDPAYDVTVAQYAALPAALTTRRGKHAPVVAIVHDVYGWAESRRIKGLAGGAVRWTALEQVPRRLPPDAALVPSRATGERVQRLLPGVTVTVVPAGADHQQRHHERRPTPDTVALVGRLVHQKGAADLITAVQMLRTDGRDVRAVIVGRGPQGEHLHALARPLGDAVAFREGISDDELDAILCNAAVLALPSSREGWGLALTEAAARGTPYVAYDIPAVREQHELLDGGLLVAPGAGALANGLRQLFDDPGAAEVAATRAAQVAAGMSWDRSAKVVEQALRDVIGERGSRSRG